MRRRPARAMVNGSIIIGETYLLRVHGKMIPVRVTGEHEGYRRRRIWGVCRVGEGRKLDNVNAKALRARG